MTYSTKGVVHGKMIELPNSLDLPDGEEVTVTIEVQAHRDSNASARTGEGIKRAAGSWGDDPDGLEAYLDWSRQQRKSSRQPLDA